MVTVSDQVVIYGPFLASPSRSPSTAVFPPLLHRNATPAAALCLAASLRLSLSRARSLSSALGRSQIVWVSQAVRLPSHPPINNLHLHTLVPWIHFTATVLSY